MPHERASSFSSQKRNKNFVIVPDRRHRSHVLASNEFGAGPPRPATHIFSSTPRVFSRPEPNGFRWASASSLPSVTDPTAPLGLEIFGKPPAYLRVQSRRADVARQGRWLAESDGTLRSIRTDHVGLPFMDWKLELVTSSQRIIWCHCSLLTVSEEGAEQSRAEVKLKPKNLCLLAISLVSYVCTGRKNDG